MLAFASQLRWSGEGGEEVGRGHTGVGGGQDLFGQGIVGGSYAGSKPPSEGSQELLQSAQTRVQIDPLGLL